MNDFGNFNYSEQQINTETVSGWRHPETGEYFMNLIPHIDGTRFEITYDPDEVSDPWAYVKNAVNVGELNKILIRKKGSSEWQRPPFESLDYSTDVDTDNFKITFRFEVYGLNMGFYEVLVPGKILKNVTGVEFPDVNIKNVVAANYNSQTAMFVLIHESGFLFTDNYSQNYDRPLDMGDIYNIPYIKLGLKINDTEQIDVTLFEHGWGGTGWINSASMEEALQDYGMWIDLENPTEIYLSPTRFYSSGNDYIMFNLAYGVDPDNKSSTYFYTLRVPYGDGGGSSDDITYNIGRMTFKVTPENPANPVKIFYADGISTTGWYTWSGDEYYVNKDFANSVYFDSPNTYETTMTEAQWISAGGASVELTAPDYCVEVGARTAEYRCGVYKQRMDLYIENASAITLEVGGGMPDRNNGFLSFQKFEVPAVRLGEKRWVVDTTPYDQFKHNSNPIISCSGLNPVSFPIEYMGKGVASSVWLEPTIPLFWVTPDSSGDAWIEFERQPGYDYYMPNYWYLASWTMIDKTGTQYPAMNTTEALSGLLVEAYYKDTDEWLSVPMSELTYSTYNVATSPDSIELYFDNLAAKLNDRYYMSKIRIRKVGGDIKLPYLTF